MKLEFDDYGFTKKFDIKIYIDKLTALQFPCWWIQFRLGFFWFRFFWTKK